MSAERSEFRVIAETLHWLRRRGHAWLFAPISAGELGWYRALFFSIVLILSFWSQRDFALWGTVDSVFQYPMPLARVLHVRAAPETVLTVLLWVWRGALFLGAIGIATRWSTALAAILAVYVFALPNTFTRVDPDDAIILIGLVLFAMAPAGDGWSVDSLAHRLRRARRHPERPIDGLVAGGARDARYGWPAQLLGLMSTLMLFSAGLAKLRQSGFAAWALSDNISLIALRHQYTHVPPTMLARSIAALPWSAPLLAAGTISIECCAPLLVLLRGRWRLAGLALVLSMLLSFWLILGIFFERLVLVLLVCFLPWRQMGQTIARRWRS